MYVLERKLVPGGFRDSDAETRLRAASVYAGEGKNTHDCYDTTVPTEGANVFNTGMETDVLFLGTNNTQVGLLCTRKGLDSESG